MEQLKCSYISSLSVKCIATLEKFWQFLSKLIIHLPDDPEIQCLDIYSKEIQAYVHTKICIRKFIAGLFIIVKQWKQSQCPSTGERISKLWHIYILQYFSAIKINELLIHTAAWMILKIIIQSRRSQKQKIHNLQFLS